MKKKIIMAALLALAGGCILNAQEVLEVKRVGLDSLINFIRQEINPRTYYIKNAGEVSTFTVSAPKETFLDAAAAEIGPKGYVISQYDGGIYILHGKSIFTSLPDDYFMKAQKANGDKELQKYLSEQDRIVTFQNKIYEIGERTAKRTGKVYISGHIRDVSTGEPLVGVSVYDEASGAYTVSDNAGFYRMLLPVGDDNLNFSGYSLDDMKLSLKVFDDGVLDIVMKEKVTALKGAVVSADAVSHHKNTDIGLERVHIETVTKIPSAFGESDVIKVVLTLPGVKSVGEASSGFNVRGGSTDQNLILFNDGTIYNPSHMFGLFSAFNTDVISGIELYKSSIPAEFGGRISSVLEVRGREGNANKVSGSLGLGLLTSRFHLEGPIRKGTTTFILGGRTTDSNWILNLLPESSSYSGGKAGFTYLNASVSHKLNDNNSLHFYGYWSRDNFSFDNDTTFRYSNLNTSVKWRSNFNTRNSLEAVAGFDSYNSGFENNFNYLSGYSINSSIRQAYAKATFKSTISDRQTLKYGFNATYYMLNPGSMNPLNDESLIQAHSLAEENGLEPAVFFSDTWKVNDKLILDGGVRMSGFLAMNPNKFYFNPEFRISGKYSFRDNLSLKAGFNSMDQYIHLITNTSSISPMDTCRLRSSELKPQTGWQAASGLYWTIYDGGVDLSLEGYYKRMSNFLDYKSGAILTMNDKLTDDLVTTYGKAYGIELMAKKTTGKLTGWISYTWSRAFLKEMQDRGIETINNGAWYCAPHDKPNDIKVVGNYKFTHRYSISFNLDYSSGRPVTIPVGWFTYGSGKRLAFSSRNGYRIPDYFRLDLAMNIEPSHYLKQLTHMSVTFGVYNITGRKNAYSVFYTTNSGSYISGHMLSVFACPIPYINLNLKF